MYYVLLPVNSENRWIERATAAINSFLASPDEHRGRCAERVAGIRRYRREGQVRFAGLYDEINFPESALSALETLEESGVTVVARREHSDRRTLSSKWPHVDADNIVICGHERILVGKTLFGSVTQLVLLSADRPVTITVE